MYPDLFFPLFELRQRPTLESENMSVPGTILVQLFRNQEADTKFGMLVSCRHTLSWQNG